jgi:LEA14-like dessication related protein
MKNGETMKNKVTLVLKVAGLIALVFVLGTCQTLKGIVTEPTVSFDSVSFSGISFTGVDLLAKIIIKNDNPVSIPFPEINWNLFIKDGSFLSGVIPQSTKIAANASTSVDLPLKVGYDGLYKAIITLLTADETPYRIDLAARFDVPVLKDKTFTTSHSGTIPLLKIPSVSFSGVKFNTVSLSKVEFVLTWQVTNKGGFPLNLDKLDYNFSVNSTPWASGSAKSVARAGNKTTSIPGTVSIGTGSLAREIVAIAAGGKPASFSCGGETVLSLPSFASVPPLRLPFTHNGNTNLK